MQRYKTLNTIIVFSVILRFCDAFQELCEIEQGVCGIEAEEMGTELQSRRERKGFMASGVLCVSLACLAVSKA
jgi:hypothetical protein